MSDYPNLENDLRTYEFGRKVQAVVISPHWPYLLEVIESYVQDMDDQVRNLVPGDPAVIAAQAALYALNQFAVKFKEDMESAVEFASHPPAAFLQALMEVKDASDVARSMERGV
jgi:hypothetical protein